MSDPLHDDPAPDGVDPVPPPEPDAPTAPLRFDEPEEPEPTVVRSFRIHPILILLGLGLTGVVAARALPFAGDSPETIARLVGRAVGGLVAVFLLAAAAWRVCGRSAVLGNLAFVVLLVAQVGFGLSALQTAQANTDQVNRVQHQADLFQRELSMKAESEGGIAVDASSVASIERQAAVLNDAAENMEGPEAMLARVFADATAREAAMLKRYAEAVEALGGAGGADPATLGSRQAIDARLDMIRDAERQNNAMAVYARTRRGTIRTDLLRAGVPGDEADSFLDTAAPAWVTQATMDIRRTDAEMFTAMRGQLGILRDTLGHWRSDPGTRQVFFDDAVPATVLTRFAGYFRMMQGAAERQLELQRVMVRRMGSR